VKYLLFYILFLILFTYDSNGQVNYVNNPSFEEIYGCPDYYGQIDTVIAWGILLGGGGGDPDLHHVCCTTNYCGVPNGWNNRFQYPKTGVAFAGLDGYINGNMREYIQGTLVKKLVTDVNYCVAFYVNLDNISKFYCNSIGAYLDNGTVSAPTIFGLAQATPQVYNSSLQLNDTLAWIKIEGSFIATGTEEYITIGNFLSDALSDVHFFDSTSTTTYAYYNIEDVSVIEVALPAHAGNDTVINSGDSVFIGRQPEVGLNDDCVWFVDGVPIDTIAGMWVKPDTNTTYILEQTICSNISRDTVTVFLNTVGINQYSSGSDWVRLCPNPVQNTATLILSYDLKNGTLLIFDIIGQEVKRLENMFGKEFTISKEGLDNGMYFFKVTDGKVTIGQGKMLVE
jgi:hypothetical protein